MGFGDGFAAFWAGEGLVEAFEDVAAGFAEEGVLVVPFVFAGGFWHVIDSMGGLGRGSGIEEKIEGGKEEEKSGALTPALSPREREEERVKKDLLRGCATPRPEARGRRKITGGTPVPRGRDTLGGGG